MKFKTKLLSVLGATAIAGSSLGLIASCSFKPSPQPEPEVYEAPTVTHKGWTELTTQEHQTQFTISGFHLSRNLYLQEVITATPATTGGDIVVATTTEVIYDTKNTFSVKVTLNVPEEQVDLAHITKFKFSFGFNYKEETGSASLDTEFTVHYPEAVEDNGITWTGGDKHFDFTADTRGNKIYEIDKSCLTLTRKIKENETIDVFSSNSLVKATIGEFSVGDQNVPVTLEIVNYPYYDDLNINNFGLTFVFNQKQTTPPAAIDGFSLTYSPQWQANKFVYRGDDSTFYANEGRGMKVYETDYLFRLDRELNTKNDEYFDVEVLDESGNTHPEVSIDWDFPPKDSRYYKFKFTYEPLQNEDYQNKFIKFYLEVKFYDKKGGAVPVDTQTLYAGSKESNKYFTLYYEAPWNPNSAIWSGDKNFEPEKGISSWQFGSTGSRLIKLERALRPDLESIDVHLQGSSNINLDSYNIVNIEGDYYLDVIVSVKNTSATISENIFDLIVDFYEINSSSEKVLQRTSSINNLTFIYQRKINTSLSVNNATTVAGTKTVTVSGSFNELSETVNNVTSSIPEDVSIKSFQLTGLSLKIDVELAVDDIYTQKVFNNLTFTAWTNEGTQYTSNQFSITFIAAPTPWEEETEEDFTIDRTFAVACYLMYYDKDDGKYEIDTEVNDYISNLHKSVARATFSIISKNTKGNEYEYYMATSWDFMEIFNKMQTLQKKWEAQYQEKLVLKITDQNLSKNYHIYDYSGFFTEERNVLASVLETDDGKADDYCVLDPSKITPMGKPTDYLKWNVGGTMMGADVYIADVDLTGTDIVKNTKVAAKLDALNDWQQASPNKRINNYIDEYPSDSNSDYLETWSCFSSYSYRYLQYCTRKKGGNYEDIVSWEIFTNFGTATSSFKPYHTSKPDNTQSVLRHLGGDGLFSSRQWKFIDASVLDKKYKHGCYGYYANVDSYYWSGSVGNLLPGGLLVARKNGTIYVLAIAMGAPDGGSGCHPWFDSFVGPKGKLNNILENYYEDKQ